MAVSGPVSRNLFEHELQDFLRFLWRPRLSPRLPEQPGGDGWRQDWFGPLHWGRLLQWAGVLWLLNLFVLGPLALSAATAGGAQHRLDLSNIPWLHALLWAPIVEEMVFRYGLRQPAKGVWLLPFALAAMLMGPQWPALSLLAAGVLLCWWLHARPRAAWSPGWQWHRTYCHGFPLVLHGSCAAFALVHLHNFSLAAMPWWLMPLLVLPQWLTGLVLAWLRVRRGIGAAVVLHGLFNGGPLLMVFLVLTLVGEQALLP